jgi:mRNA-degrading endonuclease RelE of RelBE toxin-antitoxin system
LRIGDWRVLHQFDLPKNEVHLLTVRHRREVYR